MSRKFLELLISYICFRNIIISPFFSYFKNIPYFYIICRYVLKLFRDYTFHQTVPSADGSVVRPSVDAGHVLTALNKLDARDPEELLLSSRDGRDLLVVNFGDLGR